MALALLAAVAEPWALWTAAALIGVGMAFMYPSLMALTVDRASDHERPRAISSFTMFFEVGTAVGGLALGALADVFGKRSAICAGGRAVRRRACGCCGPACCRTKRTTTAVRTASPQSRFVPVGGD